ncbi:class I SAM-dependent methyltransferase, partial [Vibrio parahaemolyticus]|nr:class I SAM-dependent methyltransferase [Vibrio parahaemolyticus]
MKTNRQEKQDFYSDSETVKKYEDLRFSNVGGQFVHQSEVSLFSQFLNICSLQESILDIPCG